MSLILPSELLLNNPEMKEVVKLCNSMDLEYYENSLKQNIIERCGSENPIPSVLEQVLKLKNGRIVKKIDTYYDRSLKKVVLNIEYK
jgi:hypothetical protein